PLHDDSRLLVCRYRTTKSIFHSPHCHLTHVFPHRGGICIWQSLGLRDIRIILLLSRVQQNAHCPGRSFPERTPCKSLRSTLLPWIRLSRSTTRNSFSAYHPKN